MENDNICRISFQAKRGLKELIPNNLLKGKRGKKVPLASPIIIYAQTWYAYYIICYPFYFFLSFIVFIFCNALFFFSLVPFEDYTMYLSFNLIFYFTFGCPTLKTCYKIKLRASKIAWFPSSVFNQKLMPNK